MSLILSVAKGRQLRQLFPLDTIYYILTFLLSHINWAKCKVPYLWCFAPDLFDHIVIITVPQLLTTLSTKPTILRRAKNLKDAFHLPFRPFSSPLCPPSEVEHTSTSRTMSTGRCTAIIKTGVLKISCPCSEGVFTLTSVSSLEVKCQRCDHLLSEHQDFRTESSPTEILASAGNFNHTQQHVWKRKCEILSHQRTYLELTTL
jgi:hypothetical protein